MTVKLYCLPGTMCDERLWQALSVELSYNKNSHVELVHMAIPMEKSVDEIITALAQQLPSTNINLLGFSLGGYLACAFACKYPERIHKLIDLANTPLPLPDEEIATRKKILQWVAAQGYSGITASRINTFLHPNHHHRQDIKAVIKQMDGNLGQPVLLQQLSASSHRANLFSALAKLPQPILFCHGDQDHLVNVAQVTQFYKENRQVSYQVIENSGHMLPLEQPKALAKIITSFING